MKIPSEVCTRTHNSTLKNKKAPDRGEGGGGGGGPSLFRVNTYMYACAWQNDEWVWGKTMCAFTSFWAPNNMYNVCGTCKNASHQYNIYGSYRRGLKRSSRRSGWGRADSLRNVSCQREIRSCLPWCQSTTRPREESPWSTCTPRIARGNWQVLVFLIPFGQVFTHTHTQYLLFHFFLCFCPSLFQNNTVVKRLAVSVTDRLRPKKFWFSSFTFKCFSFMLQQFCQHGMSMHANSKELSWITIIMIVFSCIYRDSSIKEVNVQHKM